MTILLHHHGTNGNADEYRDGARDFATANNLRVVAPRYEETRWNNSDYNRGGLVSGRDTFNLCPMMVEAVRDWLGDPNEDYFLFGFSAGGQFMSRVAAHATLPSGLQRIVMGGASTYVWPSTSADWPIPYGFNGRADAEAELDRYLGLPITVFIGVDDTTVDANLSSGTYPDAMGANRYERAQNFFAAGQAAASARGVPFGWAYVEVPGVGHNNVQMMAAAEAQEAFYPPDVQTPAPEVSISTWREADTLLFTATVADNAQNYRFWINDEAAAETLPLDFTGGMNNGVPYERAHRPVITNLAISPLEAEVFETRTASADVAGPPASDLTYRWFLDGSPISGATGATYTPQDVGFLSVEVTAFNGIGDPITQTSGQYAVLEASTVAPTLTANPTVTPTGTGDFDVFVGTSTGSPTPTHYVWVYFVDPQGVWLPQDENGNPVPSHSGSEASGGTFTFPSPPEGWTSSVYVSAVNGVSPDAAWEQHDIPAAPPTWSSDADPLEAAVASHLTGPEITNAALYVAADISSLFRDTAGTEPAAIGDTVALQLDKKHMAGHVAGWWMQQNGYTPATCPGNHAHQSDPAARPLLADVGGIPTLVYNGSSNFMHLGAAGLGIKQDAGMVASCSAWDGVAGTMIVGRNPTYSIGVALGHDAYRRTSQLRTIRSSVGDFTGRLIRLHGTQTDYYKNSASTYDRLTGTDTATATLLWKGAAQSDHNYPDDINAWFSGYERVFALCSTGGAVVGSSWRQAVMDLATKYGGTV